MFPEITLAKRAPFRLVSPSLSARSRPGCSFCRLSLRSDFSSSFRRGRRLYQKAIETTQSLVLLFQEFAVGNRLCNRRFWFWVWRYDAIIAIEPLLRPVFDREATSQLIDFCLGGRVGCENSAENCNPQPCPMTVHGFSRFALSPISASRRQRGGL